MLVVDVPLLSSLDVVVLKEGVKSGKKKVVDVKDVKVDKVVDVVGVGRCVRNGVDVVGVGR